MAPLRGERPRCVPFVMEQVPDVSSSSLVDMGPARDDDWDVIFAGALRYFDTIDRRFSGDRVMMPVTLVSGPGNGQECFSGFILSVNGMIGFFEESDCLAESAEDGNPVLRKLSMLTTCSVRMPANVYVPPGIDHVFFQEPATDFLAKLTFENDPHPLLIAILFEDLEEKWREQAAQNMQNLLILADKAIGLQPTSWA